MAKVSKNLVSIEIPIRTVGMDNIYVPEVIWDKPNNNVHTTAKAYARLSKAERQDLTLSDLEILHIRIEDIKMKLGKYIRDNDTRGLTKEQIRDNIYRVLGYEDENSVKTKTHPNTVLSYIEDYIHRCVQDGTKSRGTITQYNRLRLVMESKYQHTRFDDIDKDWVCEFSTYIRSNQSIKYTYKGEEKLYERGAISIDTANNILKNLKAILRDAYKQGVTNTDMSLRVDKIKTINNITRDTDYYLTLDEIMSIYNHTPTDDICKDGSRVSAQTLTTAKHIYLLCCTLGQRISDVCKGFSSSDVREQDGVKYVEIVQDKTGKYITALLDIPLFGNLAERIFVHYDYNIPSMSAQRINEYIKLIARQIGGSFTRTHKYQEEKNGEIHNRETPIHDLISTHDGRRSFVSAYIDAGYSWEQISKMTGHSSRDMVQLYTKISTAKQTINAFKK